MGKAAKVILTGLKKAKVTEADRERAAPLIDEAPDWDAGEAAEVEAVVRYVCGAAPELPKLSSDFLENRASALLRGLSKARELDAWDLRALDVVARAHKKYWFWELDTWLRERVVKFADQPIFDEALPLLRARGLWPTDASIIDAMVGHLTGHVTDDGAVTSTGRWLLARIDRDADEVFAIARSQKRDGKAKDKTSSLYRLLATQRRELFDALVPTLVLREDSDKSYLAQVMLTADASRFEQAAVGLMAKLTKPLPSFMSAYNLEKFFPGKHRAAVKRLLLATLKAKDVSFLHEGEADGTHRAAYKLAWPALGEEALDLWRVYEEENDAIRLQFYATIEQQAKAKALPWLVDGLVYPKDPNVEYGFVTHAKYVTRMLELLAPYDLEPYRERIEQAFAKQTNKKIREQIGKRFGTPTSTKRAAKPKAVDGKHGYGFDVYAAAVTKAALAAVKKTKQSLPSPIAQVKLTGSQGDVQLHTLVLEGVGDPVELELTVARTKVPAHIDLADGKILAAFYKRHDLDADSDEAPTWGDMYKLPWCVLLHEQLEAAHAIATGLEAAGFEFARSCKVGVGEHDNFWQRSDGFERRSRDELAALPEDQQADFAAVCVQARSKQERLLARSK